MLSVCCQVALVKLLKAKGQSEAPKPVLATELVVKEGREGGMQPLLRVQVALPSLLHSCRQILQGANLLLPQLGPFNYECSDTNYEIR